MSSWLAELDRVDRGLYRAVARARTPRLDVAMRRLSYAANYSRLSLAAAGLLALSGPRGRRAACGGLSALALAATLVNVALKPLGRRPRPDRAGARVPFARHVRMPASTSFPSGHTAAAVAFAAGAGRVLPPVRIPLYALAGAVGYSRVHTGVHYPGDVLGGAALGVLAAKLTAGVCRRGKNVEKLPPSPP
ncbi:MAG TPA: phosphatase PAP2 family protein [Solirubrobacteraceae bacterium]|jgi:membrane-associated phospholipid phosphatase|nr:phosphatase PAP2 family protein [Solirubrobacteraceae bacterium]